MRSGPATVRARHIIPAGFRPQDGERQKKRSEATSLWCINHRGQVITDATSLSQRLWPGWWDLEDTLVIYDDYVFFLDIYLRIKNNVKTLTGVKK